MSKYDFSITDTAFGSIASRKLAIEINNSNINTQYSHIDVGIISPNQFNVYFNGVLSSQEQDTLTNIVSNHDGRTGLYEIENEEKQINPTESDDEYVGYIKGSKWLNTNTNEEFVCIDPSYPAQWEKIVKSFGTYFYKAEDETLSFTNSTNYIQKLRLTTEDLPLGTYKVSWYCEQSVEQNNIRVGLRIQVNDTRTPVELFYEHKNINQFKEKCGFFYIENVSGQHNIDLDYKSDIGNRNGIEIKNVRLELMRVG